MASANSDQEDVLLQSNEGSPSRRQPIKAFFVVGICVAAAGLAGAVVMERSTARAPAKVKHPEAVSRLAAGGKGRGKKNKETKQGTILEHLYQITKDAKEGATVIHVTDEECFRVGDKIQLFHEAMDADHKYNIQSLDPVTLSPALTHNYEEGTGAMRIKHPFSPKWCGDWPHDKAAKQGKILDDLYEFTEDAFKGASVIHVTDEECFRVGDNIQLFHEAMDADHKYKIQSLDPVTLSPALTHNYEEGTGAMRIHHPFSPKWCGDWPAEGDNKATKQGTILDDMYEITEDAQEGATVIHVTDEECFRVGDKIRLFPQSTEPDHNYKIKSLDPVTLSPALTQNYEEGTGAIRIKHPYNPTWCGDWPAEGDKAAKQGTKLDELYEFTEDAFKGATVIHVTDEECFRVGDTIQLFHEAMDADHTYKIQNLDPVTLSPALTHLYVAGTGVLRIHYPFSPTWCGDWPTE